MVSGEMEMRKNIIMFLSICFEILEYFLGELQEENHVISALLSLSKDLAILASYFQYFKILQNFKA